MSKIIMFSYERLFSERGISSGPSARLFEFARVLNKKGHKITILETSHEKDYTKEGISIKGIDETNLAKIDEFDCAFVMNSNYAKNFYKYLKNIPIIVDLTTPISIEALIDFIKDNEKDNQERFFVEDGYIPTVMSLLNGDYFICSSEAQKLFFLGMLNLIGRTTKDNLSSLIDVVPVIIPKETPKKPKKNYIRGKIVKNDKKIILWPGSLFSWFDYETLIRCINEISLVRDDFALVFVGALNPSVPDLTQKNAKEAEKMAKDLGILGECIFFTDWLPHDDRAAMYLESDFCVITYYDSIETRLAYRTRIADCLWGRLPVICSEGTSLSDEIRNRKLGITIKTKDQEGLKAAIIKMLDSPKLLKQMSRNIDNAIKTDFNIESSIEKLDEFCRKPKLDPGKNKFSVFNFIEEKENRNRELKDIVNSKEHTINYLGKTNEKLNKETYRLTNEINYSKSELEKAKKEVEMLELRLREKENLFSEFQNRFNAEIKYHNKLIDEKNLEIENKDRIIEKEIESKETLRTDMLEMARSKDKEIEEKNTAIERQRQLIGRHKGSITYPLYKLTSEIGETRIGKLMQKALKRKKAEKRQAR
jgi:glycosyltransferase involved in cell wall biosynthesis